VVTAAAEATRRPEAVESQGLPILYLLGAASGGLYLLVWIGRAARALRLADETPRRPLAWALGSLAPPIAFGVLHELSRRVQPRAAAPAGVRLPALLYAVIEASLFASHAPWLVGALLRPIPVLWIQASWKRQAGVFPFDAATVRPLGRIAAILASALGAALLAGAVWRSDLPRMRRSLAPELAAQSFLDAPDGSFRLRIPGSGWRLADPRTIGDGRAILALHAPRPAVEAFVYQPPGAGSLDDLVDARRRRIQSAGRLMAVREERRFADGPELRPLSLAVYRCDVLGTAVVYVVLTSRSDDAAVELVGYGPAGSSVEEDLVSLAQGFAWLPTTRTER